MAVTLKFAYSLGRRVGMWKQAYSAGVARRLAQMAAHKATAILRGPVPLPANLDPLALARAKANALAKIIGKFVSVGPKPGFTSSGPRELLGRAGTGGSKAEAAKFVRGLAGR